MQPLPAHRFAAATAAVPIPRDGRPRVAKAGGVLWWVVVGGGECYGGPNALWLQVLMCRGGVCTSLESSSKLSFKVTCDSDCHTLRGFLDLDPL